MSMSIFAMMTDRAPPTDSRASGSSFESNNRPRGGEKLQTLGKEEYHCHLVPPSC